MGFIYGLPMFTICLNLFDPFEGSTPSHVSTRTCMVKPNILQYHVMYIYLFISDGFNVCWKILYIQVRIQQTQDVSSVWMNMANG